MFPRLPMKGVMGGKALQAEDTNRQRCGGEKQPAVASSFGVLECSVRQEAEGSVGASNPLLHFIPLFFRSGHWPALSP